MRISTKLTLWFLAIALIPVGTVAGLLYRDAVIDLHQAATDDLRATAAVKARQIEGFFLERQRDAMILAQTPTLVEAMREFGQAPGGGAALLPEQETRVRQYLTYYRGVAGLEDICLVTPAGDVVFSLVGGEEIRTNLRNGPLKGTELAAAWDRANTLLSADVSDFAWYAPSEGPAAFSAAPMVADGAVLGAVALQLGTEEIDRLVLDSAGIGSTGETLVAGAIDGQAVLLTPTRHDKHAAFRVKVPLDGGAETPLRQAVLGKAGAGTTVDYRGREVLAVWRYVPICRWGMVVKMDTEEAFATTAQMRTLSITTTAVAAFLVVLAAFLVARTISRPLRHLARHTEDLVKNDFRLGDDSLLHADTRGTDVEVALLAQGLLQMQRRLVEYLEDLRSTTAAKERIESDVRIARDIQASLLPKGFSPFPNAPRLDLHAVMEPAKEVGGDLYDFTFLDDHRLFFAIGDVSDKGVGAALFMAITKALLRTFADLPGGPVEAVERTNRELARGNETCQFVTLFCGVLDLRSGQVIYADAGHNPPVVVAAGGPPRFLEKKGGGLPLAIMEDAAYSAGALTLAPGDVLFLYTDGVTEARNPTGGFYGDARLASTLARLGGSPCREITARVMEDVRAFAQTAPQSDDITVMGFRLSSGSP